MCAILLWNSRRVSPCGWLWNLGTAGEIERATIPGPLCRTIFLSRARGGSPGIGTRVARPSQVEMRKSVSLRLGVNRSEAKAFRWSRDATLN